MGGVERNALTILWRIENLSYFQRDFHGYDIQSPVFHPLPLEDKWTALYLFPRGGRVYDGNICLRLDTESLFPIDCEFSLLASDGSPLVIRKGIQDGAFKFPFRFKMTDCPTQEELFVTKKSTFLPHDTLTVRCRVWKSEGNFPHNEFISARNRIEFAKDSILLPTQRFIGTRINQRETITVPLQYIHEYVDFDLESSLSGDLLQDSELNIIVTADEIPHELLAKLEVSISHNKQQQLEIKVGEEENSFSVSKTQQVWAVPKIELWKNMRVKMCLLKWGARLSFVSEFTVICKDISFFIEHRYLDTYQNGISHCIERKYFGTSNLEEDSARPTITFSEASRQTSEQSGDSSTDLQRRNDCLGVLGEDFLSLYQNQTFSDFELLSGEVCFPVHKSVLCARSPVFNSMFSNQMKESNSKSLEVPDLDAHALNRLLTFLYGGTVEPDLPLGSAANLYYAADKYQVHTLKSLCASILQSQISVSNVSDILTLANRHQDLDLMSFVHNFIISHFDDVMDSKEWEKFLDINPSLAGKSAHLLYKEQKERKCVQKNRQ